MVLSLIRWQQNWQNLGSVANTSNGEAASNTTGDAKTVNDAVTTSDAFKQETETAVTQAQQSSRGVGFEAIEDVQLVIDTSNIQDGDGIGSTQVQWQISENGDELADYTRRYYSDLHTKGCSCK